MARRPQLTAEQRSALFDPPRLPRELVRHYTLSGGDLDLVLRCRGDHNRLGYAVQLAYLRCPGRLLRPEERPPAELVEAIADQLGVPPCLLDPYLAQDQTRRRHAGDLQDRLKLRPFTARHGRTVTAALMPTALVTDRLVTLVTAAVEIMRTQGLLLPPPATVERLCLGVRHQARRQIHRILADDLTADQRRRLDALTELRPNGKQSWLAWLRQAPTAAKPMTMAGVIERLEHVRAVGLTAALGQRVHKARLSHLAVEAARTTAQHLAGMERRRRHAVLVATVLDLTASLTDQALDVFERLVGALLRTAEERHARAFARDGRAIHEKVRLYGRIGQALIASKASGDDPFAAIDAVLPWERFVATVAEASDLARTEDFDFYQALGERYAGVRRWAPAFLAAFEFQAVPAAEPLMRAIKVLRDANASGTHALPKTAPTAFVKQRWARHVFPGGRADGNLDRRYYELCVLAELRDRLRAGDVWVVGSRRYRSFEEHLITPEAMHHIQGQGPLPLAIDADVERFLAERRDRLDRRLAGIDGKLGADTLVDVSMVKGALKITPITKAGPPEAEAVNERLYAMLPRVRITDLLAEVDGWTGLTDCFAHLRTGEPAEDRQLVMTGILADGLNLGLTRMAEACRGVSLGRLAWMADWHIRDETYALALQRLVEHQHRQPLAAQFGGGFTSSSDGQFFRAGGFGRDAGTVNSHYGREPGVKFYTHLSDRFAPFHTRAISATAGEAIHVLDGLLHHAGAAVDGADPRWTHHTDGGGVSDSVFALCALLGFRFAPRIPDLKDRKLHSFQPPASYPALAPLIGGRIDVTLIRAHWTEILRLALSIRTGTVAASVILRQLGAYPRQNGLALALRELGRLERTLFTLDWLEDPAFRRQAGHELNKGEARNSLARAVFIHRLGEIRDRTYENQQHRASGLNLVVAAIILWNTRYLERAVAALQAATPVTDDLLAHLSPLGWEHINLTGDYVWASDMSETIDGLRALRTTPSDLRQVA